MPSHEFKVMNCKLSKSGKGIFFSNDAGKKVSVKWDLLSFFEINEDNYLKINNAVLVVPEGSIAMFYGVYSVKAIEDLILSEDPEADLEEKAVNEPFIRPKRRATTRKDSKVMVKQKSKPREIELGRIELDEYQTKAFEMIAKSKISIITGFAGTGKSSTVRIISERLILDGWNISRVAPTGKASKVIGGNTVHSWLEPILKITGQSVTIVGFKKDTMLDNECLIIDESSMMDNELWEEVKKVWNWSSKIENKKIIFVGDQGQLKPVGEGEPFLNSIESKIFPITELKTIHRIKGNSEIIDFVNRIRGNGTIDVSRDYRDIAFISKESAFDIIAGDPTVQMITPLRNYSSGSLEINRRIKALIGNVGKEAFSTSVYSNTESKWVDHTPVHANDKIIIVKNLWEWDITNGTTGIFIKKERAKLYNHVKHTNVARQCYKFFNTTTDEYFYLPANAKTRQNIELAYAITIHKAQGSEFNDVIIYLNGRQIDKRMLYTAVTRAKKTLKFVL